VNDAMAERQCSRTDPAPTSTVAPGTLRPGAPLAPPAPFALVGTREVYRTRWMRLREDTIRYTDGSDAPYGVVERSDFVLVVPRHEDKLLLVCQYRHPIGRWTWELPQGACATGESVIDAARRELSEETGWEARECREVGRLFEAAGFATQSFGVVVATLGDRGAPQLDREEAGMESTLVSIDDLAAMVASGELQDAPSLAALHLADHARAT
jgi:8-oxo-dGTP pyrophosphatase MutT (NUDIX family)